MPETKPMTASKAKKKAWDAFSIYIRKRDAERDRILLDGEQAFCISCRKAYPVFGVGCMQAGHFIPGRGNKVLFNEKQVHAQCYNCNINLKGNWAEYYKKMVDLYGVEEVEAMINDTSEAPRYKIHDYLELEQLYKEKARAL